LEGLKGILRYRFQGDLLEFKVWNIERNENEIQKEMFDVYPNINIW
jgi:hypothetical protein